MSVIGRAAIVLAILVAAAPASAQIDATFHRHVLTLELPGEPAAGCFGTDGRMYVAQRQFHRVDVFDLEGRPAGSIGRPGEGDEDLLFPSDVACVADEILVLDTGHGRVNVYDRDGSFRRAIGRRGHGLGELHEPLGLDAGASVIAVADTGNDRVQLFARDGTHVGTVGGHGGAPGRFAQPQDVALGIGDTIIVADTQQHRVQVLDRVGRVLSSFGVLGPHPGMLARPSGLALDGERIYVADTENHRMQVFDPRGKPEAEWGVHTLLPHEGRGRFHYPRTIALHPGGTHALVCEPFEGRCQLLARGPSPDPGIPPIMNAERITHYGRRADVRGTLLAMTDLDGAGVTLFDLRDDVPIEINRLGEPGPKFGAFLEASGVSLDDGRVLVADAPGRRLTLYAHDHDPSKPMRFDPTLSRLVRSVDFEKLGRLHAPLAAMQVVQPVIARSAGDDTWILDAANERLHLLEGATWRPVRGVGGHGIAPGEFRHPTDFAVSRDGIVVVDSWNFRVQVLDHGGRMLRSFGERGIGPGQFLEPFAACVSPDGSIYVSDRGAHRVLKFDREGRFLLSWGSGVDAGSPSARMGAGALHQPAAVAWHPAGLVIVVDHGNHRGQIFTPGGVFVRAFGARFYIRPTLGAGGGADDPGALRGGR